MAQHAFQQLDRTLVIFVQGLISISIFFVILWSLGPTQCERNPVRRDSMQLPRHFAFDLWMGDLRIAALLIHGRQQKEQIHLKAVLFMICRSV